VRSLQLQAALSDFVAQAADRLQADIDAGHEVPFELASRSSRSRGSSPLYCYRPLTGAFLAERFADLRDLDGYGPAAGLLQEFDALDRYLIATGADDQVAHGPCARADAALLALLQDVFEGQSDFDRSKHDRHNERLDLALERLDGSAYASAGEVTLVATLHGLTIASPELSLTRGLSIAHPDAIQGVPEQALRSGARGEDDPLLVVFHAQDPDPRAAIAQGREVVRELLRALRLFGDGRIALGPLAFARIGSSPWDTIALGTGGRPHGMLVVSADQEDELRAFCNLISRRSPHGNQLAWALQRFELGCERASEYEGISDHLMALRVLLGPPSEREPHGAPDGLLAARLAALCATPDLRAQLTERTLKAITLERHAIAGTAVERASGHEVARELSSHLRSLLRDILCGHLSSDLASLADELLLSGDATHEQAQDVLLASGEAAHQQGRDVLLASGEAAHQQGRDVLVASGEQMLGDRGEPSEILHVAV
jgi:hypothetical protein